MTILSDKWIEKSAKLNGMIKPFVSKQVRKGKIYSVFHLTDMMPESLMSLKFLLTLIQEL